MGKHFLRPHTFHVGPAKFNQSQCHSELIKGMFNYAPTVSSLKSFYHWLNLWTGCFNSASSQWNLLSSLPGCTSFLIALLCLVLDTKGQEKWKSWRDTAQILFQAWPENLTSFLIDVKHSYSLQIQRNWNNSFLLMKCSQWAVKSSVHICVSTASCSCSKMSISGSP